MIHRFRTKDRPRIATARGWLAALTMLLGTSLSLADDAARKPNDDVYHAAGIDQQGIAGTLLIGGGGGLDASIMERFVELAGGADAKLVVIPTASQRADQSDAETLLKPWEQYGVARLSLLHTRDRSEADQAEFVAPLKTATAVWLSGGSQSRIAEAYGGTAVEGELHALLKRDGVIGGTSAGAAIMSREMIASGKQVPRMARGLGLLPGVIIDQHFLARKRQPRLWSALADHPGLIGLGIDEQTAVEVRGRTLKILGDSTASVMLSPSNQRPSRTISLRDGQRADLVALRRAAIDRSRPEFPGPHVSSPTVASGALIIVGGGKVPAAIADRFIELAGGSEAKIVVLPTAGADQSARRQTPPSYLSDGNVQSITMLPQRRRDEIASEKFVAALREATGIWFSGGRQWRLVDAYEGTPAVEMFRDVLRRGGVIGGSSAGASIQAEYMVRGHPLGNQTMMAEGYERGLNFLPGVAIDQHFSQRGRFDDLRSVVRRFPQLLGIGLDESTAICVQGSTAEVIGSNEAYFLDESEVAGEVVKLSAGSSYDLVKRTPLRLNDQE